MRTDLTFRCAKIVLMLILGSGFALFLPQGWCGPGEAAAAVAVLDAWPATPQINASSASPATATFTPSAGSNRLIVISVNAGPANTTATTVSVDYGNGSTWRPATSIVVSNNAQRRQAWLFYLNEADIAASSGSTIRVTDSNLGTNGFSAYIATYSGVDQSAPVTASYGNYFNSVNPINFGTGIAVAAGGYGIFGVTTDLNEDPAITVDLYAGNARVALGGYYTKMADLGFAVAKTTNPTITYSGTVRAGLAAATLNPAAAGDTTLPTVSSVVVQSGSTVDVTFSEAMGAGVTTATNYTVSGTGQGTLAANPSSVALVSGNTYRLTWSSGEMRNSGTITVTVANVQDLAGNTIGTPNSGTHTGGAIGTAPSVSSTIPVNSAAGVALNSTVTINWSENVDCTTVTTSSVTITPAVTWNRTSCSGSQAVFTPSGQVNNTGYTVTVGTGVTDAAGNAMAAPSGFSYTTVAGAGTIAFSSATYTVGEAGPTVTITVTRTGGSTGAVGITYRTSNGTATAGLDYTAVGPATLSWANGDAANKTFTISILDDSLAEGDETFSVALSAPTNGVVLGSTGTAVVTIVDNDPPGMPSGLSLSLMRTGGPTISWSTVSGATGYNVYRSTDGSTWGAVIGGVGSPATAYADNGAPRSNTVYYWTVTAVNGAGESAKPAGVSGRTALYRGYNMVSAPFNTAGQTPITVFGSRADWAWNWESSSNVDPDNNGTWGTPLEVTPGKGMFLWAYNDSTMLEATGSANPAAVTITLLPGWNAVANQTVTNMMNIGANWIVDGSTSLTAGITNGIIGGSLYWWDGVQYQSLLISIDPTIEPWKAYFILNQDSANHTLTIQ